MASSVYPLPAQVRPSGTPYTGSHGASAPRNWESRNAYDLDVPAGTPVVAVADGVIGDQIGSLHSSDPKMQGLRVHLVTDGNEFYYAHLSKLAVKAGQHVKAGDVIGYSGKANGVEHLHFAAKHGDPIEQAGAAVQGAASPSTGPAPVASAPSGSAEAAPIPNQYATPPPIGSPGAGPPAPADPGTVQADGRLVAETWQKIASQPGASVEAQGFAQTAALAHG